MSGQGQMACQKAFEAGGKQSGIEKIADSKEKEITKNVEQTAKDFFGSSFDMVAGIALIVNTVSKKQATVGLPNLGICDSMRLQAGIDESKLQMEWKF